MERELLEPLGLFGIFSTASGENVSFSLLSRFEHNINAICWTFLSGDNDCQCEAYVDSMASPPIYDIFSTKAENSLLFPGFSSSDIPVTISRTGTAMCAGNYLSFSISAETECSVSLCSSKGLALELKFNFSEDRITLNDPNNLFCASVEGFAVDAEPQTKKMLFGKGWIVFSSIFEQSSFSRPSTGLIVGSSSSGENFFCSLPDEEVEVGCKCSWIHKDRGMPVSSYTTSISFEKMWTSTETFQSYPTEVKQTHSLCEATFHLPMDLLKHETYTSFSNGRGQIFASFHGLRTIGSKDDKKCDTLSGVVLCIGRETLTLETAMEKIGKLVQLELGRSLSNHESLQHGRYIVNGVYAPIKILVDRGGKSWRSFLFCSIVHLLSRKKIDCRRFLLAIELLHIGSLIIDDIEDSSSLRRGGLCVHQLVGTPTAINSGSTCFFSALHFAGVDTLPPLVSLRVHQMTMEMLRLGHIGQGLDISYASHVTATLCYEQPEQVLAFVEYVHSLKSGELVSYICSLACVVADASPHLTESLSIFGKQVGIAFQIVDDILDITSRNTKKKFAEDILNKKITYPIAKALTLLPREERKLLFHKIIDYPAEGEEDHVNEVLEIISHTDAVSQSRRNARDRIINSWTELDPKIPNCVHKQSIFALCQFMIHRTL